MDPTNRERQHSEERIIPVTEEEIAVTKRVVETGSVRVEKHVEEHVETVDVPLLSETVEVRRVPVNQVVAAPPPIRRELNTVIVPVVEEEVVVTRRFVVKEEIHLTTRRSTERRHHEDVTLRRERAEIKRS